MRRVGLQVKVQRRHSGFALLTQRFNTNSCIRSCIRNHRQFRLNISYCEDFRVNLKPLFLNIQDGRRSLGCLVTLLTVVISAIRVTVASRPRTDYQTDHRLVHPDR